jgi:6-pyruvoyltetrahydropterin/6-carboxytetrahydropterin synthase
MRRRYDRVGMFRLSREVRFAVSFQRDHDPFAQPPTNGYAGYPSMSGLGAYYAIRVTLAGPIDPASSYLVNIKWIDHAVRDRCVPLVYSATRRQPPPQPGEVIKLLYDHLLPAWAGRTLEEVWLSLSPFLSYGIVASELPMIRLSQKFEFSATHRLHNPQLDEAANRETYGKCNNPYGHGHNYEVQVTLRGQPDSTGLLIDVPDMERIVAEHAIEKLDHKNLNAEVEQFKTLIPSVENIAMVIFRMLRPHFDSTERARLAAVTVWETPKTWCEYSE